MESNQGHNRIPKSRYVSLAKMEQHYADRMSMLVEKIQLRAAEAILEEMTYSEMNFSTYAFISIFFSTVINISFKPRDNLGNTAGKPLFHHGNNTVLP